MRSFVDAECIRRIIIVDNESRQAAFELDDRPSVELTVLRLPENRGFAGGINAGLSVVDRESETCVFIVNSDATISPESVDQLRGTLASDPSLGACSPRVESLDGSLQSLGGRIGRFSGRLRNYPKRGQRGRPWIPEYLSWACVMLNGEAICATGLLDERFFMYWEDLDYSIRLRREGWLIGVTDTAVALHQLSASGEIVGNLLRTYYSWGLVQLWRKYPVQWATKAPIHLGSIVGMRCVLRDGEGLAALLRGVRLAIRTGSGPAYLRNPYV